MVFPSNFPQNLSSIALIGYYGFGNIGDDLLLLTALNEYNKAYSLDIRIIANKHPYLERMLKEFEFTSIPIYSRWDISSIAQSIRYSDALVFGGGGIFQDETSFKSFFYYFFNCFLSKLNKRHLIIDRNSIGPINSNFSKYLFNYIVKWAFSISVRDNLSYEYLINNYPNFTNKFYKREDFVLSPFFDIKDKIYSNFKEQRILFILRPIFLYKKNKKIEHPNFDKILEVIRYMLKDGSYKNFQISIMVFMEDDLEHLWIENDLSDIFEEEVEFNIKENLYNSIIGEYKNFKIYYPGYGNIIDALKYIKESLLVISNRLHGILLAKVFDIPALAISNSIKIQGICQDYNIPFIDINQENINEKIISFINENLKKI
ncbi:MAG: polysaccharide pyruvyl transferase family protein [bacterium]